MPFYRAPTETPIRVALLSGHTLVLGPQPRPVPDLFLSHVLAAGAVAEEETPSDPSPPDPPEKLKK